VRDEAIKAQETRRHDSNLDGTSAQRPMPGDGATVVAANSACSSPLAGRVGGASARIGAPCPSLSLPASGEGRCGTHLRNANTSFASVLAIVEERHESALVRFLPLLLIALLWEIGRGSGSSRRALHL